MAIAFNNLPFAAVTQAQLDDSYTDDDMVAEWVGLHYKRDFNSMSTADQDEYRERFFQMHEADKSQ